MTTNDTAPNSGARLRKGVELDLDFTDLLANGQGVGRAGGLVVFCFGPLPGELARVRITDVKQRYAVATMLEILRESAQRAKPFCPVFGVCGGCQIQHLTYTAQLVWKRGLVRDALQRIGGLTNANVSETIGMEQPRSYRNKMSLVVDGREDPAVLGFYKQRSHQIVPIDACPIVTPKLDADLHELDRLRRSGPVGALLRETRHLVSRSSAQTGSSVVTITTARRAESAESGATALMRDLRPLAGVTNSFDLSNENAILGRRHRVLAGNAEIEESIAGIRYRISPGSFFQVNVEMVGRIFTHMIPWLEPPGRMLDLYCGVGTFSLFFAKHGWRVHGIEESAQAIEEAVNNAGFNDCTERVCFTPGRVEQLAAGHAMQKILHNTDVVFLDPPRKGSDEVTLGAIAGSGIRRIWYLSCDPATLARDSKFLVAKGYRLGAVQPFDMFPQTGHVECLVQLECS
ncbi:MAG: 23S rRNA (uracil(1939)-C(5))-methyltransferase RlmD [Candidatus Eremiobacteraeota bacterium]|nr:23S rRNA (uracil(1939)-C(5))-methyltransferase RlmD [Candidatus Eremiobacteraeota bacterium]